MKLKNNTYVYKYNIKKGIIIYIDIPLSRKQTVYAKNSIRSTKTLSLGARLQHDKDDKPVLKEELAKKKETFPYKEV